MPRTDIVDAIADLRRRFPHARRVYVAGCAGEPRDLVRAFREAPELAADLIFLGIWIPGVNETDWASLHERARAETIFLSPALRPSFEAGRTAFRPLSYSQAWPWLCKTPLDIAVAVVSPPGRNGDVSLGVAADFSGSVLARQNVYKLALVNSAMPAPADSPRVPLSSFDATIETDTPLLTVAQAELDPAFTRLARNVATLIEDGDTLQFGLGNVQHAVIPLLKDRKALKIHSGMVSDALLCLLDSGAVSNARGAVTTGVALGAPALYDRAAADPRFSFRSVDVTHAHATLSAIENLKAVNSVISVDLFGQANAEFIRGRQVSGTGGLVDFLRGASSAPGGRAIAALLSSAKGGTVSRIVTRLPADAVSIARADLGTVVTEHGVADLRNKTIEERAEALIGIADPGHRESLAQEWAQMRAAL